MTEEKQKPEFAANYPAENVTLCLLDSGEGHIQEECHDRSPQRHEEQD